MLRFALLATILTAVIFVGVKAGTWLGWFDSPSYSLKIVIFMLLTHLGLYSFITRRLTIHPSDFVKVYLGITVLRILFFGAFIFIIIRLDRAGAAQNASVFLVSYFLFTALEVTMLFREINAEKFPRRGQKEG